MTGNPLKDALQMMSLVPGMGMASEEDEMLNIAADMLKAVTGGDKATAEKLAKTLAEASQAGGKEIKQNPLKALSSAMKEEKPVVKAEVKAPPAPKPAKASKAVKPSATLTPKSTVSSLEHLVHNPLIQPSAVKHLEFPPKDAEALAREIEQLEQAIKTGKDVGGTTPEDILQSHLVRHRQTRQGMLEDMQRQNYELMRALGLIKKKKFGE
jgi:hypothetical protein